MTIWARPSGIGRARATVVAMGAILSLSACGGPCINGSLDLHGNCTPVESSECLMRKAGDPCLDTGTCNTYQECEIPGGKPQQLGP